MSTFEEEVLKPKENEKKHIVFSSVGSDNKPTYSPTNESDKPNEQEDIVLQVKNVQNVIDPEDIEDKNTSEIPNESKDNLSVKDDTTVDVNIDNDSQELNFNTVSNINIDSGIEQIYEFTINELYRKLNQNEDIIFPGKKHKLPAPIITYNQNGSRRTVCSNFDLICNEMNRKNKHVADYIKKDLGIKNTVIIGSSGELRIVGRFDSMFGNSLDRYINEYVLCKSCCSIKTNFIENMNFGLDYVVCTNCQQQRSVK